MQNQETFSILLVDDDPTVIRVLNHILSEFSPVRFATSGRTALKLARESIPDLVILDVDMPEVSGFEVCKLFKSDAGLAAVPIVFITGHDSPQLRAKGLEIGAADFIDKPPHAPLVLARVRMYQRLKALSDTLSGTLRNAVTMDFLTGAVTRRQLEKSLDKEWLRTQRTAAPLALLIADIEGFTGYNAECGEQKGDTCLKAVADALRSSAHRPIDVLGRWAGGQFALLLPETDASGSQIVATRALDAVGKLPIRHATAAGRDRGITVSIGAAHLASSRTMTINPAAAASAQDFILAAEHALQCARSSGERLARIEFGAREPGRDSAPSR